MYDKRDSHIYLYKKDMYIFPIKCLNYDRIKDYEIAQ